MICETCGGGMVEGVTTGDAPYAYTLRGLPGGLCGIRVYKCAACNEAMPVIPRIEELHNLIADVVVKKTTHLNGNEIRFLRKHAGYPAKEFAVLLQIDASHLSRVENGHTASLGPPADILARALTIATTKLGNVAREAFLEVAKQFRKKSQRKRRERAPKPIFSLDKRGWKAAA